MCGVWTEQPETRIARGTTADISLHVWYTAQTDPKGSVLNFFNGSTLKISPTQFVLVHNGDVIPAKISAPADAPAGYFDFVTLGLWCGDAAYTSWYYVRVQDQLMTAARRAAPACLLPPPPLSRP
jgi:hypothetical protein